MIGLPGSATGSEGERGFRPVRRSFLSKRFLERRAPWRAPPIEGRLLLPVEALARHQGSSLTGRSSRAVAGPAKRRGARVPSCVSRMRCSLGENRPRMEERTRLSEDEGARVPLRPAVSLSPPRLRASAGSSATDRTGRPRSRAEEIRTRTFGRTARIPR